MVNFRNNIKMNNNFIHPNPNSQNNYYHPYHNNWPNKQMQANSHWYSMHPHTQQQQHFHQQNNNTGQNGYFAPTLNPYLNCSTAATMGQNGNYPQQHRNENVLKLEEENGRLKNELNTANDKIKTMEAEMETTKKDLEKFNKENNENKEEMSDLRKSVESLKIDLQRKDSVIEDKKRENLKCQSEMEAIRADYNRINLQLRPLSKRAESQEESIKKLREQNSEINKELENLKVTEKKLWKENEKLKEQTNRCEELEALLAAKNQEICQMKENHNKEEVKILMDTYDYAYERGFNKNKKDFDELKSMNDQNSTELALSHVENKNLQVELEKYKKNVGIGMESRMQLGKRRKTEKNEDEPGYSGKIMKK